VVSSKVKGATNKKNMAVLSTVDLACRNDWTMFMNLCNKSLMLQPLKIEVISLIRSEREFPSFLWFICGTC
jgi:hypothetical protein